MRRRYLPAVVSVVACVSFILPMRAANAELLSEQDPKLVLEVLINTFQRCGPTPNFYLLGQHLFQVLAFSTGGLGCYPQVQALGSLQSLKRLGSFDLPAGSVVTFNAQFENGAETWQIGVSRLTQKVEWLTEGPPVSSLQQRQPTPDDPGGDVGNAVSGDDRRPEPSKKHDAHNAGQPGKPIFDPDQGCVVYPAMCHRDDHAQ